MTEHSIIERDLPKILRKVYAKTSTPCPKAAFEALIDLCEWQDRLPICQPRTVYVSQEINRKILTPFELQCLATIKKKIIHGGDLKPYLGDTTRSIRNRISNKNDYFSSDWGLLHFHMGADFENKGKRVNRSRRILIARIEESDAYLVDVVPHGVGHGNVWGDTSHLTILYKNFPHLFHESIFDRENPELVYSTTATDHINFRNSGINAPFYIDGKFFVSPTLGITMDRSSIIAVDRAIIIHKELKAAEAKFKEIHPDKSPLLAIGNDCSIGFYLPDAKKYDVSYSRTSPKKVVEFFKRVFSDIPAFKGNKKRGVILPV